MQRVHPTVSGVLSDDDLVAAYEAPLAADHPHNTWLRVNFVMSLDGSIVGADGLSKSLGTKADATIFRLARRLCDVILVGAGTLRTEDYRPSVRPLAIVSQRLNLRPDLRLFTEHGPEHVRPIVLTTEPALDSAPGWLHERVDLIACGGESVDLHEVVSTLASRGHSHILCEGGPALFTDLLEADLVDELLLTVVPRLVGMADHLVERPGGFQPPLRLHLTDVLEHQGTLLTRYRAHLPG